MYTTKPHGKGLTSFILGLLLATVIIGGLVFMLNKNPNTDFKTPVVETELPPPEILTPQKKNPPQPKEDKEEPSEQPSSGTPVIIEQPKTEQPKPKEPEEQPENPDDEPDIPPPPSEPKTKKKLPERTNEHKKPAPKEPKRTPKPTPEQILNSGSIEKAREAAAREADGKAKPDNGKKGKGGAVVVQAGSYSSRDKAEAQRNKLRAAGVQAEIATATVQGKTMYRVQTLQMDAEAAAQTRDKLKQQDIDSFIRPSH